MKKLADIRVIILLLCAWLSSCASVKSVPDSPRFAVLTVKESDFSVDEKTPQNELETPWQLDVTFPDWAIYRILSVNSLISFRMYHGQGSVFLTPSADCKGIKLYINGEKISLPRLKGAQIYEVDISGHTRDGINTLHVSGIKANDKNTIRVCVPYPKVLPGKLSDSGIPRNAIRLIDKIVSSDIDNGFSSAQLAVVKDGRLVYENSWGNVQTYDAEGKKVKAKPVTQDTMYDIASVTKMFSAAYAMQYLVAQGKVTLETKVVDILGESFVNDTIKIDFKNHEESLADVKAWKAALTVRDVLSHRAGEHPGPFYFNDQYDVATGKTGAGMTNVLYAGADGSEKTRQNTLVQLCRTPLTYEPHTDLVYSDVDYMLLCFMIEKITGMRLDEYLSETFWKPLGLEHITYNPLEHGFSKEDCAATEIAGNSGYTFTGRRDYLLQGEVHDSNAYYCMGGVSGHAGIFSSATDLAILASLMLTGGYGDMRFFSRGVLDAFTAAQTNDHEDYGLGWWRQGDFGTVKHFGSVCPSSAFGHQGFTGTVAFIDPEKNLVIVFLTNKRHVPFVSDGKLRGNYAGNYYACGSVTFVPQIIELGLTVNPSHKAWKALASDMAEDMSKNIPAGKNLSPDDPRVRGYASMKRAMKKF